MGQEQKKVEAPKDEKPQSQQPTQAGGPPETGEAKDKIEKAMGQVQVIHGIHDKKYDVAGQTVGYVRENLGPVFNIPGDAQALINGEPVTDETVINANTTLEFIKNVGQKG